ncbi:MAG: hypothetical protein QXO24_02245 [Candidatus Micrarchaeaceae archaeon]
MRKYVFSVGLAILLVVMSGCGTDPEVQLAEISRNTVMYDEIVRLNNCGGKGDSDHTATREFATTIEFGAGISAGYKSIVEGNIAAKYSEYRNTSKSLRVVAPPGTNMEFVLRWSDDVRAGNVQVNGKSGTYEVRIPVAVEQISSRDWGCGLAVPVQPTSPSPQYGIPTPLPTSPLQALQTTSPRQQSSTYCYGQCWQYDHNARTMTWTGSTDGIEDIWQPSGEPLQRIREGYIAIFTTSVPGEIYACVLVVNGQSVKNACDGILYPVQPGTYRITSSNSQVGGFRWCPLVGYGWRVNGGECE